MQRRWILVVVLLCGLFGCEAGFTSSPDAWQAFREQVAAACSAAAGDELVNPVVTVDPFGTSSYGLALVCGQAQPDGTVVYRICVFDKHSRHVELGGELDMLATGACN